MKISRLITNLCRPFFLMATLITLLSCEKEPGTIGLEITPPLDELNLETTDTATIIAYSEIPDSLITSHTTQSLLGSINDRTFGRTDASIYTQMLLSSVNVDFGTNPQPDSLVLFLKYNGYYGDTNIPLTIRIYEVAEQMYADSVYYSFRKLNTYSNEIGQLTFYPHPKDSVIIEDDTVAATLRIRLDKNGKEFARKLLAAPSTVLADNDEFVKYLYGLYLKTDPVNYKGSILYFNMTSSPSGMKLYYHNDENDSLSYSYVINDLTKYFNHYDHEGYLFADPKLRRQVIFNDTSLGNQIVYLQGMGGIKVRLWFPYLKNWTKVHRVAINEAELIITNIDESGIWSPPSKLVMARNTDAFHLVTLGDDSVGTTYFGGSYNSTTKEYRFRLNRYVQDLVNQEDMGDGLTLLISGSAAGASRLIMSGPKAAEKRLRLRIRYTYSN